MKQGAARAIHARARGGGRPTRRHIQLYTWLPRQLLSWPPRASARTPAAPQARLLALCPAAAHVLVAQAAVAAANDLVQRQQQQGVSVLSAAACRSGRLPTRRRWALLVSSVLPKLQRQHERLGETVTFFCSACTGGCVVTMGWSCTPHRSWVRSRPMTTAAQTALAAPLLPRGTAISLARVRVGAVLCTRSVRVARVSGSRLRRLCRSHLSSHLGAHS